MIKSAHYGSGDLQVDLTEKVKKDFIAKKSIFVSNQYAGFDPYPNVVKDLKIVLDNGEEFFYKENTFCHVGTLDKSFNGCDRIGIFYTNNGINPEVVNKSLETIEIAKNFSKKTEIIVCPYKIGNQNYFMEVESIFKIGGHINIVTQILQALYTVKNYSNFKYVSFLEHDVMYPENYFVYEDLDVDCAYNDNYIGICKNGFQKKNQHSQPPLHQMTMKYEYALKHFERLLSVYMSRNFEILEPSGSQRRFISNPSVHINHGNHLTSHYSIYSKETTQSNDYWGSFGKYSKLFT